MNEIGSFEEYRKHKQEKHQEMLMKQNVPYRIKRRTANRMFNVWVWNPNGKETTQI